MSNFLDFVGIIVGRPVIKKRILLVASPQEAVVIPSLFYVWLKFLFCSSTSWGCYLWRSHTNALRYAEGVQIARRAIQKEVPSCGFATRSSNPAAAALFIDLFTVAAVHHSLGMRVKPKK